MPCWLMRIERYPVPDPDDVWPDEAGWYPTL